ncbi:MAG: S49 family peptidase [Hyphomicrobiaceae bacterium]|nr:MAG: S49 family peptidase [Hyphomicrobiaceae bacterium]
MTRYQPHGVLALAADAWGLEIVVSDVKERPPYEVHGDYAVVSIVGPMMQHASPFGCESYASIAQRVAAAAESDCAAIMLKISSPGGEVSGCFELVESIRSIAKVSSKKVVAYADGGALSAGYALACAADEIVVPPSGEVGSIGTIMMLGDETAADKARGVSFRIVSSGARKGDQNPHVVQGNNAPDGARESMQRKVDAYAALFFDCVATARTSLSADEIKALDADTFVGAHAVQCGLADRVATFAALISEPVALVALEETTMTDEEKAKAALLALAEGDDEEVAQRAKAAIAVLEGDEEKKDDDADEVSAESEPDKVEAQQEDDEPKAQALALAAQVQALSGQVQQMREKEARAVLMATRPDLNPEVVSWLNKQSLSVVREALKVMPRSVSGQVGAAQAAIGVAASVEGKSANAPKQLPGAEHNALLARMGIKIQDANESRITADGGYRLPVRFPKKAGV